MDRYLKPDPLLWQGRTDEASNQRIYQAVQLLHWNDRKTLPPNTFVLIGFACDEGIKRNFGRIGAAEGPAAIRKALAKQALPHAGLSLVDLGDISCLDGDLHASQESLAELVSYVISQQAVPIVLGGGHEMVWGHYAGIKQADKHQKLSLVNFDAHYDLRPLRNNTDRTSGTSFLEISEVCRQEDTLFDYTCIGIQQGGNTLDLIKTANRLGVQTVRAHDVHLTGVSHVLDVIQEALQRSEHIYLSICMDVFAAAHAPGVSAPQPLGLMPWQVIAMLEPMILSKKIIGFDIAEVSPRLDRDNMTSELAASLLNFYFKTAGD